ncbi:MAG: hypothetical protein AUJ11_01945 [Parcubacteria group bacterium CG1_02_44_65]|uniref:Glycosyltransferase family 1 protein n=3 Tax=Candidatus Portnoyibacteriota TaxID=1817913 RepID=A0A2M7YME7_9BACT|nr:MAG: hypothetical protein AUJ11_01945 [Parcubacteria group bacterium CG1_02_44_65]PIP15592.1 MAG: hypothetical protein COX45_01825 [Candidatus Portnoybacteria bacterium CG23_combo_of_CG06-09_8_20_14_all_44_36]PIZ69696.1 MAG: hypothetical protein COY10_01045 [Candidatus Portnoybacteria bacterium CG_4_10_14_0_2_um_filter_43_36]PJA64082.1 MAG: hypothetical protein CO160_00405 [Candidatus Portnoybacteria bacterium CG_4_9_14_3_um_filter_43_11]PJE59038.1 MAG: hypothetical protein COU84_02310 [Cand
MEIGINAAAALKQPRTGVEEYVYQLLRGLTMLKESKKHRFILFSPSRAEFGFGLPDNFKTRELNWPLPFWTQARLAGGMIFKKPEVLFIPVHVLPLVHPKNSVVTIHGLEYEYFPEMYPKKRLTYLRWGAKYAVRNASKIIAVSENTKNDLIKLYGANPGKVAVVHHGVKIPDADVRQEGNNLGEYFLYLGRLEEKKNMAGLIGGFEMLKKRYQLPHKLVLAGPAGFGYKKIKSKINRLKFKDDIIELGYIGEREKWRLLGLAEGFVFPSFYEGFGLPILEAQASGCPVITSDVSSMPEVAGQGAILIRPEIEQICRAMYKIIDDADFKKRLIEQGYQNVKKFSWQKCARRTLKELTN